MDLKKEIKLSDLFKRKPKEAAPVAETPAFEESPAEGEEKRKRFALSRAPKAPKEPKPAKAPKAPKAKAEPVMHGAQPFADVPLMRAFNLLPREIGRESRAARPRSAQLVLAVVSVVLLAGLGFTYMTLSAGVDDKRATRDGLKAELAALEAKQVAEGEVVDPALVTEKNARTFALATALSTRVAWDRLLREVSLVIPEDAWLTGMVATPVEVSTDPTAAALPGMSTVTISGYTYAQDGVARALARLAVVPELTQVSLVSSQTGLIGDTEVIQFAVSAFVKLPGGASA